MQVNNTIASLKREAQLLRDRIEQLEAAINDARVLLLKNTSVMTRATARIEALEAALRRCVIDLDAARLLVQHALGEPHGINQTLEIARTALDQSSPPQATDIRWAVNVLLEQIAAKFEAWDTHDIWRSEAALTVRSFKHALAPEQDK